MKLLMLLTLSVVVGFPTLATASDPHSATRITKNEAQHLALDGHPGGRVTAANLDRSTGHAVWRIEIVEPNAPRAVYLSVDATSGRVFSGQTAVR